MVFTSNTSSCVFCFLSFLAKRSFQKQEERVCISQIHHQRCTEIFTCLIFTKWYCCYWRDLILVKFSFCEFFPSGETRFKFGMLLTRHGHSSLERVPITVTGIYCCYTNKSAVLVAVFHCRSLLTALLPWCGNGRRFVNAETNEWQSQERI